MRLSLRGDGFEALAMEMTCEFTDELTEVNLGGEDEAATVGVVECFRRFVAFARPGVHGTRTSRSWSSRVRIAVGTLPTDAYAGSRTGFFDREMGSKTPSGSSPRRRSSGRSISDVHTQFWTVNQTSRAAETIPWRHDAAGNSSRRLPGSASNDSPTMTHLPLQYSVSRIG